MSKEKAEVGDIWQHKQSGFVFRITNFDKDMKWTSTVWQNGFVERLLVSENFYFYNTYLGKAKTNIKELFELEN